MLLIIVYGTFSISVTSGSSVPAVSLMYLLYEPPLSVRKPCQYRVRLVMKGLLVHES